LLSKNWIQSFNEKDTESYSILKCLIFTQPHS